MIPPPRAKAAAVPRPPIGVHEQRIRRGGTNRFRNPHTTWDDTPAR